ncbi:SigE family RNA polymerase sigma factor [Frankia sp. CNm7]|uniref:SigE family RNA polymerase sigma factor n=1 Tax=Frankia nepalensis TaxID=1836974 RepID=A0A937RKU8_9ACTN|nr:SigE family RNA polymerase sigma factor [Frankia nepalensis]MBL7499962.1 SigE family RNA polymerase sigma factor [Frankia nepalensis]MBL7512755.1 SigE family RNA polymerase sigma factor [Frankia nepalensis]MBL7517827.1 SigE family RNA polymerase sigma factor [Frankia nepalensis]MBL7632142.1 SigE family RNA polymerase sigma factor [Frankia nepalensis]
MDDDFTGFVRSRGPALGRTAYLLTGDAGRAEDLVQSALLAVWQRRGRVEPDRWEAYTRRTMINLATSWWRRLSSTERTVATMPDQPGPPGPAATDTADDRVRLVTALRRLPARQRAAVVLRHYEDLSEAETAKLLGCSAGTVKSLTHHGLNRLRALLAEPAAAAAPASLDAYPRTGEIR